MKCHSLEESIAEDPVGSPEGYIFELDLDYPIVFHITHNGYPHSRKGMLSCLDVPKIIKICFIGIGPKFMVWYQARDISETVIKLFKGNISVCCR